MKPVTDRAEVSIDFPDKAYMGSFGRDAEFDVRPEDDGVVLKLLQRGDQRREVSVHIHYYLLADIISEIASVFGNRPPPDDAHREPLLDAARALRDVLQKHRIVERKAT